MTKKIAQLNSDLAAANSDTAKIELKSQIEEVITSAEVAIRKHQREVDYDTKEFTIELDLPIQRQFHQQLYLDQFYYLTLSQSKMSLSHPTPCDGVAYL